MTTTAAGAPAPLVLVDAGRGVSLVPQPTPLTRLNYFDGKFLRADDLAREQAYLRGLVHLSNRAGGWGVVHGLEVTRGSGASLRLSDGLAIDPEGRPLLLPEPATLDVATLLERSRETEDGRGEAPRDGRGGAAFDPCEVAAEEGERATPTFGVDLHLLVACHAEALCGEEEVYGRLCEDACSTDTDRPYRVEGMAARLLPLSPGAATCGGDGLEAKHLRSLVASALFADERRLHGRGMSAGRLRADLWCRGARPQPGTCVPLAVVATRGGSLEWIDAWAARRERIDAPAQRWWQWRTEMRPLDVFWAQVLQFQCHLRTVLGGGDPAAPGEDACSGSYGALKSAERLLAALAGGGGASVPAAEDVRRAVEEGPILGRDLELRLGDVRREILSALAGIEAEARGRVLIDGGIVELPSAGWLPVVPDAVDVGTQVRRLLGEGVDLRVCAVPADVIPHAWEEAQHMERICLLSGLDDPARRPPVDVLVPEGRVVGGAARPAGLYEADLSLVADALEVLSPREGTGEEAKKASAEPEEPRRETILRMVATAPASGGEMAERIVDRRRSPTVRLRGAARAAAREGGGGTLHLAAAGAMEPPERQPPAEAAERVGPVRIDPAEAARIAEEIRRNAERAAEWRAGAGDAGTEEATEPLDRSLRILDEATDGGGAEILTGAVRALLERVRGGGTEGESGGGMRPLAFVAAPPPGEATAPTMVAPDAGVLERTLGLWVGAECDGDPFALPVGGSVRLRATVAAGLAVRGTRQPGATGVEAVVDGTLTRVSGAAGGDELRARVRLHGRRRLVNAGENRSDEARAAFGVALRRSRSADGGAALEAEVDLPGGVRLTGRVTVRGTPSLVSVRLSEGSTARPAEEPVSLAAPATRETQTARGSLREDAEVRRTDHPAHAQAVQGLDVVAGGLRDDDLRASAAAALFPPQAPGWGGRRVLATRDWVLFHRRRPSSCDCCTPLPAPEAGPRRYRLFHLRVPAEQAGRVAKRVLAGDDPGLEVGTVGVVPLFDPEGARLRTDAEEVRRAWRDAGPGDAVVAGIVARAPDSSDGPTLLDARLARVADAVDDVTPDASAAYEVLPQLPAWLDPADADGVILLVTAEREAETVCQRVFALSGDLTVQDVERAAEAGRLPDLLANAHDLGAVGFGASGTEPVPQSLQDVLRGWEALGLAVAGHVAAVPPGAPTDDLRVGRVKELSRGFGGGEVQLAGTDRAPFGSCEAVFVVLGRPATRTECVEVFVSSVSPDLIGSADDPETLRQLLARGQRLGEVHFPEGSGTPRSGVTEVDAAWRALGGGRTQVVARAVAVVASGGDPALAGARSTAVAQALGFTGSAGSVALRQGLGLPSNCGAVLLLRPQKRQATRTGRLVVHTGHPDGRAVGAGRAILAEFDDDGTLRTSSLTDTEVETLREQISGVGEFVDQVQHAVRGGRDAAAPVRLKALAEFLRERDVLRRDVDEVTAEIDRPEDDPLWTTPDGVSVDDLFLLRLGGVG